MNTPRLALATAALFSLAAFGLAAPPAPPSLPVVVQALPARLRHEKEAELLAVSVLAQQGSPGAMKAATSFTSAVSDLTAQYTADRISGEELSKAIDTQFDGFKQAALIVLMQIKTKPENCTVQWKPALFGAWADVNEQGSYVGYGRTRIRVAKPGFRTADKLIDTKMDPTVETIVLEKEPVK